MNFTTDQIIEARTTIKSFLEFAKRRMYNLVLQLEKQTSNSTFAKNCEDVELHIDDYDVTNIRLILNYGYGSSGSYNFLNLPIGDITTSDEKWEDYSKNYIQKAIDEKNLKISKEAEAARLKRLETFNKLKEEFSQGEE